MGETTAVPCVSATHELAGLTKEAALGYANQRIRNNSVQPGNLDTPLLAGIHQETPDGLVSRHPIERLASAEELAKYALFVLGATQPSSR